LGERVEAVAAWKRTLEVDPKHVEGYERAARLLLEIGRTADALTLANDGIAAIPSSVSLRVSKSEALEKQGQHYAARETLRGAVAITSDTELLRRFAIAEDRYGRGAPAYRLLASKLDPAAPDIKQVLERGRLLAVREQDDESAEWFTERLGDRVNTAGGVAKDGVEIPGGLSALAFVAGGKSAPQERFWAEYCRYVGSTLTERTEKEVKERLSDKVSDYLLRVRTLAGTSRREGDTVKIALDASDKAGQKRTESYSRRLAGA
jgi:tetratricopeptide (TPR) repeat protein